MANNVVTEYFYIGRDNTIDLTLTVDGVAQANLSAITRMVLKLDEITIDSDANPDALDWNSSEDDEGNDKLVITLTGLVTEPMQAYATLIVYDAANTNGIVWIYEGGEDRLRIKAVVD